MSLVLQWLVFISKNDSNTQCTQHCMGIKVLRNCYFHVMETCPFKCQNSVYFYHFLKIEIVLKYKIYYLS